MKQIYLLALLLLSISLQALQAQQPGPDGKIMLTVFLRHDQSKTLDEINGDLDRTGFRKNFPPDGVEIVSYNIVMGVGHIITLRFPADKLRDVNVAFEKGVWGAFRTEFYPTYDYLPIFNELKQKESPNPPSQPSPSEAEKKPAETPHSPTPKKKKTIKRNDE